MGFELVFDYVAGKQDWLANDLPIEGKLAAAATLGTVADRNVATCSLADKAQDVKRRLTSDGRDFCVVIDDAQVVLGLVRTEELENSAMTVEPVMKIGPSTFRPHLRVEEMSEYLGAKTLDPILVTTSDGRLVGAVRRKDLTGKKH